MKYPSRRSMTSGTPESIQNWVLSGFQNCLDLASISPLEAKVMSSSATVTSAPGPSSVQPNKYPLEPFSVKGSKLIPDFLNQKYCHAIYQVIPSAL